MADNPGASDLRMARFDEVLGKACVACDEPLAGDAKAGARVLMQEQEVSA